MVSIEAPLVKRSYATTSQQAIRIYLALRGVGVHTFFRFDEDDSVGRGVFPIRCNSFCAAGVNNLVDPPPPTVALPGVRNPKSSRGLLAKRGVMVTGDLVSCATFSARFFLATRFTMR